MLCAQIKGGHSDPFLNKWHKAPHISRGLLSRPPSLEQSEFTIQTIARVKLIKEREYWDYYYTSNIILVEKIVPIISLPPGRSSRRSFGDLYGVTLRTLPQACFQLRMGDIQGRYWARPLNAQDHAAVFSYPVIDRPSQEQWVAKRVWVYHWNV